MYIHLIKFLRRYFFNDLTRKTATYRLVRLLWKVSKKKFKYLFIRYLESITQALFNAYFGLDSRE
jgi:hypothetical protein